MEQMSYRSRCIAFSGFFFLNGQFRSNYAFPYARCTLYVNKALAFYRIEIGIYSLSGARIEQNDRFNILS